MDQFTPSLSQNNLSNIFQDKYKKQKLFIQIAQNKHLVISVTCFLTVSDIINFGLICRETYKIIQKNPTLQNKILKAHIDYLTNKEERILEFSPFNKKPNSAYDLISSYYQSFYHQNDLKLINLKVGQSMMTNSFLSFFLKLKAEAQKKTSQTKKNTIKNSKQQINQKQKHAPSAITFMQLNDHQIQLKEDKQLELLTKWEKMSRQKQYNAQTQKFLAMSKEQKKKFIIQKYRQQSKPYVEVNGPDKSLIVTKVTFWDRLRSKFA